MILMCICGLLSIDKLNRQFFPNFDIENISVSVEWPGATAEEIDRNIISILEPELRPISGVKKVFSKSIEGIGYSVVEFNFGKDMQKSMQDVETAVSRLDFPQNAKKPKISLAEFYDTITRVVLSGNVSLSELRKVSKDLKEKLLKSGVDKVVLIGLPDEEILIDVSQG
jgi:multidrug efflux pump subunit AcrB